MNPGFHIDAASGTHNGGRTFQEDRLLLAEHPRYRGCVLAVIADGMGGLSGGRKAADQVILTATQLFEHFSPDLDDAAAFLRQISMESHKLIRLAAFSTSQQPHSTIAAFLTTPRGACHWIHAGDTRIYQFRGQQVVQKTTDHSYVQTLIASGRLTPEEAHAHPQANVLTSCLGTEDDPLLETSHIRQMHVGDAILACTDGLWHYLKTDELRAIVQALSPEEACQLLIEIARKRAHGRGDNLSVIVLKVRALADVRAERKAPAPAWFPPLSH